MSNTLLTLRPRLEGGTYMHIRTLIEGIQGGDASAESDLCGLLTHGLRLLAQPMDDDEDIVGVVQATLLAVVEAVRAKRIHNAEMLGAFAHSALTAQISVAKRRKAGVHPTRTNADLSLAKLRATLQCSADPFAECERAAQAKTIAASLTTQEHELLWRFYIKKDTVGSICKSMSLSNAEFRATKAQAKAKFATLDQPQTLGSRWQYASKRTKTIPSCA